MPDFPPGTFPVVFESGVLRFDDDGTLNVHLSHGPDAPHPMQVQEHDDHAVIPGDREQARIRGASGPQHWRARASMPETDVLPDGFVFTFSKYSSATVEMSGDLSILVEGATEVPSWFVEGKVHRFMGPDERLQLWSGSGKPPAAPKPTSTSPFGAPSPAAAARPTRPTSSSTRPASSGTSRQAGGCASVILAGAVLLPLGALLLS